MTTLISSQPPEKPREKLIRKGALALTDEELLAILLGTGTAKYPVLKLARKLLSELDNQRQSLTFERLSEINGIGPAKACTLMAAIEFARRRIAPASHIIREARDILPLLQHLSLKKQEHFTCTSLNGAHEVIETRVVTIGLVNACQIHPREVLCDPIVDRATAIIIAHNHPSGSLMPSEADRAVTRRIREASEIVGIKLIDHIIFSGRGYYSFQESGAL